MADSDDEDDVQALQFLSRARLPDVSSAGAQGKERARLAEEKKKQRKALQALQPEADTEGLSDVSTDMEGASDSEHEEMDDSDDDNASDLEEAYLQQAAKRDKRQEKVMERQREALANRRLPVRAEDGEIEELDEDGSEP